MGQYCKFTFHRGGGGGVGYIFRAHFLCGHRFGKHHTPVCSYLDFCEDFCAHLASYVITQDYTHTHTTHGNKFNSIIG